MVLKVETKKTKKNIENYSVVVFVYSCDLLFFSTHLIIATHQLNFYV